MSLTCNTTAPKKILHIGIIIFLILFCIAIASAQEVTSARRVGTDKVTSVTMKTALLYAPLSSTDLSTTYMTSANDLAGSLLGSGVTISNVQFTGAGDAAGTFAGGLDIIGFDNGVILSSGDIAHVIGPNELSGVTKDNGLTGDADLDALIPGYNTYDATILEFDFIPTSDVFEFEYVFTSDEYNEWVHSPFNDVFGFFVNGQNVALIPGTTEPVSINHVNKGTPVNTDPMENPKYYINNDFQDGTAPLNTEMDGLTTKLTATVMVKKDEINHIRLAIADAGDHILDSNVFIRGESVISPDLTLHPLTATNDVGTSHELVANYQDAAGNPIVGATITFTIMDGPNVGMTGQAVTDSTGTATWSYSSTLTGQDTLIASAGDKIEQTYVESNQAYKMWKGAEQLTLSPMTATNQPGETHVLVAKYLDAAGNPLVGTTITFTIMDGPNVGITGQAVTDSTGTATWSYSGSTLGTDIIIASAGEKIEQTYIESNQAYKSWTFYEPEFPTLAIPFGTLGAVLIIVLYIKRQY